LGGEARGAEDQTGVRHTAVISMPAFLGACSGFGRSGHFLRQAQRCGQSRVFIRPTEGEIDGCKEKGREEKSGE
jgi:hypothetical protein